MLNALLYGRYRVLKKLAEGGMGAVYLAEDAQLFGRQCVVKEMLPNYTSPADKLEAENKFRREAELLANLNHPGVPQVYQYFVEQDRYYLVMQFVEGENLEERLMQQGGPLPEQEVLGYARQLASVLAYIAGQTAPVIHRDIKPANIILEQVTGQVKLVDFGIAKAKKATAGTKTTPMGTIGYAPPEQHQGQTEPRTDVFALGATVHHLLTGRDPSDPQQAPIPFDYPPARSLAPAVSAEMETILDKMLEKDVNHRPTAAQLKADLDSLGQPAGAAGVPFALRSGAVARTPQELGGICDQNWADGVFHLYQGHFEPWFQGINRYDLSSLAGSVRQRGGDQNGGLEEFLRALNPTMPLPVLALDSAQLDFGAVERGDKVTLDLTLYNTGRGYLYGEIKSLVGCVNVRTEKVGCMAGSQQVVQVILDTTQLGEGTTLAPALEVNSNGGQQRVAVQVFVIWQPRLKVQPGKLDFGDVLVEEHGKQASAVLTLTNAGGGVLDGRMMTPAPWISLPQSRFQLASGQSLQVTVVADTSLVPALSSQAVGLPIAWGSEITQVPARIGIKKVWYDPAHRAGRWLAYAGLVLVGLLGWAYGLGFLARQLRQLALPGESEVMALPVAALLLPFLLLLASRHLVSRLDEIEAYYYQGDLAADCQMMTFGEMSTLALLAALIVVGLGVGGAAGMVRSNTVLDGMTLLGGLAGALLGGLLPRSGLGWPRVLGTGLGSGLLGALLVGGSEHTVTFWAAGGLLLALLYEPSALPLRLRWFLARAARPVLVFALATAGVLLGQAVMSRFVLPPFIYYSGVGGGGAAGGLRGLVILGVGLAGALLGLWIGLPAGTSWRDALRPGGVFGGLAVVTGLVAIGVGWVLFTIFSFGPRPTWGPGVLVVVAAAMGVLAWLTLRQGGALQKGLATVGNWVKGQLGRVQGPAFFTQFSQRVSGLTISDPLQGLDLALALSVVAGLVVLMPFVAQVALGVLQLFLILAGIALVLGILAAIVIYVIRQNRP